MSKAGIQVGQNLMQSKGEGWFLVRNGNKFRVNSQRDVRKAWKCMQTGCLATLCTRNDLITRFEHDRHPPDVWTVRLLARSHGISRSELWRITLIEFMDHDDLGAGERLNDVTIPKFQEVRCLVKSAVTNPTTHQIVNPPRRKDMNTDWRWFASDQR